MFIFLIDNRSSLNLYFKANLLVTTTTNLNLSASHQKENDQTGQFY